MKTVKLFGTMPYWSFIDHGAADPRQGAHYFVIECKRLGSPPSASWILNENYVHHGILRFIRPDHGYAKGETSAAMVGYIESMEHGSILAEVNAMVSRFSVAMIAGPSAGWRVDGISRLDHHVARLSPEPALALRHLWVDLRSCFGRPGGGP